MNRNKGCMRYALVLMAGFLICTGASAQASDHFIWTDGQLAQLQQIVDAMPAEGLGDCKVQDFSVPNSASDPERRSRLASIAANQIMKAYLLGCSSRSLRAYWHIKDDDSLINTQSLLLTALVTNQIAPFFEALRPRNPNYQALRAAYGAETDSNKRGILVQNMERWRWMPMTMGEKYLVVNAASYEVTLWENDKKVQIWPVIVGKIKSPTPVFQAEVGGVVLNPWWEIPSSIVAEGIGSMVRNRPATARRKGYVYQNGRYRQRPGPGNALGQMKLVMPNSYSVYLHDTPNKKLFSEPVRTFSHDCIRVGGAIDLAKALLENRTTASEVDEILTSRKTTTISLKDSIPIYIAYFTAEAAEDRSVQYFPDVYGRDHNKLARREDHQICPA